MHPASLRPWYKDTFHTSFVENFKKQIVFSYLKLFTQNFEFELNNEFNNEFNFDLAYL